MNIIDDKICRRGVTLVLAVIMMSVVPAGMVQAQSVRNNVAMPAPSYGIPPSANTQRALADDPGVSDNVLSGFYASLGVAIGWTDNVNRVPSPAEDSDTVTVFTPALGYRTSVGRHEASIDYVGFAERYQDFDNLDAMDNRVRAAMEGATLENIRIGVEMLASLDLDSRPIHPAQH